MMFKRGQKIKVNPKCAYSNQGTYDGKEYQGLVVATKEDNPRGYQLMPGFGILVLWDWEDRETVPHYHYAENHLIPAELEEDENGLVYLTSVLSF